ncbi:hypothetical protein OG819_58495 [Streptomyces sp. NBC_01549]|uniref:hypothetical protein n=1 Tax=Streptomyces sp. NBC_01549 TaxID=2975874 RepID=UPI00225BA4D5|nr:hypothetical protein [Streptomyces sp. NBC_01549]MCX4598882.1 hypothetical protein [Streptomyces sp. NBC_01549]
MADPATSVDGVGRETVESIADQAAPEVPSAVTASGETGRDPLPAGEDQAGQERAGQLIPGRDGQDDVTVTDAVGVTDAVAVGVTDVVAPAPGSSGVAVPLEELAASLPVHWYGTRPVMVSLPVDGAPVLDPASVQGLARTVPGVLLLYGRLDGDAFVRPDGRRASLDTVAATLAMLPAERPPVLLMMPGGDAVAHRLATTLGVAVTGARGGVQVLPDEGRLRAGDGGQLLRFDPDAEDAAGHPLELLDGDRWRPGARLADTGTGTESDAEPTTAPEGDGMAGPAGRSPLPPAEPTAPPVASGSFPVARGTDTDVVTGVDGDREAGGVGAGDLRSRRHPADLGQGDGHAPSPSDAPSPSPDPTSFEARAADPRIRSIGVPKAGLPHVAEVVGQLRAWAIELGHSVPDEVWNRVPQQLLSNYPFLLSGERPERPEGLLVSLGPVEALVTLDPRQPAPVANPAGSVDGPDQVPAGGDPGAFRATAAVSATYATGAHVQSESSNTGATRLGVNLNFGVGLPSPVAHLLSLGGGVSGVANQSGRTTTHVADSERGHVEDNRAGATLVSYEPNWSVRLRPVSARHDDWRDVTARPVGGPESQRLLLWVPKPYLEAGAGDHVVATGEGVLRNRLPGTYFASGVTGLPTLFDGIAHAMEEGGVPLSADARTHDELIHKLWNLPSFLDHAVNGDRPSGDHAVNGDRPPGDRGTARGGYTFRLHNKYGRTVATITVHAVRLDPGREQQVGATSDTAHLESVRTAIDGVGGEHRLGQSSTLTLNAGLDVIPRPPGNSRGGLNISVSGSVTWNNGDSLGASRTGLWVMVPRFAGATVAYRTAFMLQAQVTLRREGPDRVRATGMVESQALLRLPQPEAFRHGFPVERSALRDDAVGAATGPLVPYDPAALRGGPTPEQLRVPDRLPRHLRDDSPYRGVGMGLVEVPEETADHLFEVISGPLRAHDFLLSVDQENPIGGQSRLQPSSGLESRVENEDKLRKFVGDGLAVHHDRLHQDGLTLVLHRRRGFAGMEFDVDAARVTIRAERSRPIEFLDRGNDHHLTNLAMGMDSASMGVSGGKTVSLTLRARGMFRYLLGGGMGVGLSAGRSASENAFFLNNRPELLESSSAEFLRMRVTSTYTVTIEFQHSGLPGMVREGQRDPAALVVPDQPAIVRVLPLGDGAQGTAVGRGETRPEVLDQAVIFHLDSKGLRGALNRLLPSLDGPQGSAARTLDSMAASLRAHMKEAAYGGYTTDQPFDNGLLRDTFAALDVKAKLGPSEFLGASSEQFVQGAIKLWLSQAGTTTSTSWGVSWTQADVTVGGVSGARSVSTSGSVDTSRRWQFNTSENSQQAAAKELIQLSFSNVYLYGSEVELTLTKLAEKRGKLMWSARDYGRETLAGREMLYLLPEPEALALYAAGDLPVSDQQLTDAMGRWAAGSLKLPANTVARLLARWRPDTSTGHEPADGTVRDEQAEPSVRDESDRQVVRLDDVVMSADGPVTGRRLAWARLLREQHADGRATVWDADARAAFREAFGEGLALDPQANPLASLTLPEYLTRRDPGGNILGHSNVISIDHEHGRSTADLFREAVEQVAPGLLTRGADLWTADGRHIGRLQGSLDAVLNLFSRGREDAVYEDLLSPDGVEFYLVDQVGWFNTDLVKVTVKAELRSGVEVLERRPDAGLENYGHHQSNNSVSSSRDIGQTFTVPKISSGQGHGSGGGSVGFGTTRHEGLTHAESRVREQTVYSWDGLVTAQVKHTFRVAAAVVDMPHRPLNEWSMAGMRVLGLLPPRAVHTVTADGVTRLHLPSGIAGFTPAQRSDIPAGPRDLRPLGRLPGDAYVAGVVLNQSQKTAEDLLRAVFGVEAAGGKRVSSLLNLLMSRTHLTNVLGRVGPGERVQLSSHLFEPGASGHGVKLFLRSAMYDVQVLGDVVGTGTGRYSKHQSGTSVFASTDHWRPTLSATGSGSGAFGSHDQHSASPSTSLSLLTSATQKAGGTANYRREQHVKQQGPVKLVRIRVQVHLEAEDHRTHIFRSPTRGGLRVSEPVNGEMYVEVSEDGLRVFQQQLADSRVSAGRRDAAWEAAARATPLDLAPLLVRAAREPGADPVRADLVIGRLLADQAGPLDSPRTLALTVDPDRLALELHRATLDWAVRTLQDDHAAIAAARPGTEPPPALADYRRTLDATPHTAPPGTAELLRARTDALMDAVRAYHATRPDNPDGRPPEPPAAFAYADMDREALVRDLAHHMDAHVRFAGGGQRGGDLWIDPAGAVHASYPGNTPGPRTDGAVPASAPASAPVPRTPTALPVSPQVLNHAGPWLEAITRRTTGGSLALTIAQHLHPAGSQAGGAPTPAPASRDTAPWHVTHFEEGAHELSPGETWWLQRTADHFASTVARRTASGELARVRVAFTGRGNGSSLFPDQARLTATDRAKAARRIWEERLSQPPNSGTLTALDYDSSAAPAERLAGEASREANRTVTVRVDFIPHPAPAPHPAAEDTRRPAGDDTHGADPNPRPEPEPEPDPAAQPRPEPEHDQVPGMSEPPEHDRVPGVSELSAGDRVPGVSELSAGDADMDGMILASADPAAVLEPRPPVPGAGLDGMILASADPVPAVTTAGEQVAGPGPERLSSSVTEFGTTRAGAQGLVHITPVSEDTVGWLQEQVIRRVEGGRGEDPGFRRAVRDTLTSRVLSSDWGSLLGEHGMTLRAAHEGRTYQISLRLGLSDPRHVSPRTEEPAPQLTLTHDRTTTSVTADPSVRPMVLLRSRERSWPIAYGMKWELGTTPSPAQASTASPFPDQWHPLTDGPGTPLTVWFPHHLVEDEADPVTLTSEDPEQRPAPMRTLLDRVPLFATDTVPRADAFLSDVLRSFPDELADLSEPSLDQLRRFLAEGSLRGNLPLMYGGHHTTPTLFARDGSVIGMLRLHADVIQRTDVGALAGPPTRDSVLESHVLRSVRLPGGAAVTDAAGTDPGGGVGGFAAGRPDPATGTDPSGSTPTGQAAVRQQPTDPLASGGGALTSRALRTARPLLQVNADAVYEVTLVRPGGPERGPAEGTPLAAPGTRYPLILRVPSAATVSGAPRTPRHLPPEILHLQDVDVSVTPLAVEGTGPLFDGVESWLRDQGFLPPSQDLTGARHQAPAGDAVHLRRLDNLRTLDQMRSSTGLRAGLDEMTAGGHTTRFEVDTATGVHQVTLRISVERRYHPDRVNGGVTHDLHLTHVRTLHYSGSTVAGDEQPTRLPLAVGDTAQASPTGPFDAHGDPRLQGQGPEDALSRRTAAATDASAGAGHEFHAVDPAADGVQVHTLPVTYRTSLSYSDGPDIAQGQADGQVTLAVPTYRTLERPAAPQQAVAPPPVRPPTHADADDPADLQLPETAWPERVGGSGEL